MAQQKTSMTFNEGMKLACSAIVDLIKGYAEEKYDDYEYRHMISAKERLNNEFARDVIDDLVKFLENIGMKIDEKVLEDKLKESGLTEPKENEDVGTDGNGETPAEDVHAVRSRSAEEVSEIHSGFYKA